MAVDALTTTYEGKVVVPATQQDWRDWVSATSTQRYLLADPLLDWLDLYGEARSFNKDHDYPEYDPRTDFTLFATEQGRRFGESVVGLLESLTEVTTVSRGPEDLHDLSYAERTFDDMLQGLPVIHQGVLWDAERRTYGSPDVLIRSDILRKHFPDAITEEDASIAAPDIAGATWHYRVIDIKFRTLRLSAKGELGNDGSTPAYKVQLFVYNQALGRLQGFEAPVAYLLGRGWEQTQKGETSRGFNCMERLGPVTQAGTVAKKRPILELASEAIGWVRRVRHDGADWTVLPRPSIPELYPNPANKQDSPWHHAKRDIAQQLEDLTLLWQVGPGGRSKAHEAGVFRWRDSNVTPEVVGVTGKRAQTLTKILDINREDDGPSVRPSSIRAAEQEWREIPQVEFYVDFETVSDLADDFARMPQKGGQTLIFMIGCGHLEHGKWHFASFLTDALIETAEAEIIDAWFKHMLDVQQRLAPHVEDPRVIHWSPAEQTNFETAYNSAKVRHNRQDWPSPRWFDFLRGVVHEEPVVVRGAMSFGLKAIAKAMHSHGHVTTLWDDGPADGLGAMVGAWWCAEEAKKQGTSLAEIDLMKEIVRYNEVDCRVMMEIVHYLRANH